MSKFLFNISNHPAYDKETGKPLWSEAQIKAAEKYGEIVDIPFPSVSASETISGIHNMADRLLMQAKRIYEERGDGAGYFSEDATFMVQGEARLETALNEHAEEYGLQTVCAGSDFASHKEIDKDGNEVTVKGFEFKAFREVNEPGAEPPKPLDLKQEMEISRKKFREAEEQAGSFVESITGKKPESLAGRFNTDQNFPTKQEMALAITEMKAGLEQHNLSKEQKDQMTAVFQNLENYGMQVSQGPAFVNAANFPSTRWSDEQKRDAAEYGIVVDLKTPSVPGSSSHEEAKALAHGVARDAIMMGAADVLLGKTEKPDATVMVTWESSAKNMAISELKANDVQPVAICSERNTTLMPDGTRVQKTVYEGFQNIADREEAHKMQLAQEPEMTPWQAAVIRAELADFEKSSNQEASDAFVMYCNEYGYDMAKAIEKVNTEYKQPASIIKGTVEKLLSGEISKKEAITAISSHDVTTYGYGIEELPQLETYLTQPEPSLQKPLSEVRADLTKALDTAEKEEQRDAIFYAKGYLDNKRSQSDILSISRQTDQVCAIAKISYVIQEAIDDGKFEAGGVSFEDITVRGRELARECYADLDMDKLDSREEIERLGENIPERITYNAYERGGGEEPDERDQKDQEEEIDD